MGMDMSTMQRNHLEEGTMNKLKQRVKDCSSVRWVKWSGNAVMVGVVAVVDGKHYDDVGWAKYNPLDKDAGLPFSLDRGIEIAKSRAVKEIVERIKVEREWKSKDVEVLAAELHIPERRLTMGDVAG